MKIKMVAAVSLVVMATSAFAFQQMNLASMVSGCVSVNPAVRANSAATGANCDIRGYRGAAVVVGTGLVDNIAGSTYAVLQDSVSGSAFAVVDSIAVDSVDAKYYDLHYKPTRNAVALRVVLRATGAADTIVAGAIIQRLCSTRPC